MCENSLEGRKTIVTTKTTDDRYRVCRGGSRNNTSATFVRAACRSDDTPTYRINNIGFRTAQCGCRQSVLKND